MIIIIYYSNINKKQIKKNKNYLKNNKNNKNKKSRQKN